MAVALGSVGAVTVCPQYSPAIMIGTAIAVGLLRAAEIALAIILFADEINFVQYQGQLQDLNDEVALIDATQNQLDQL
ncbi:hypothetical protein EW146_g3102 [Bondarzewia mesenterica]|uniref:Uncharacterized protein n=1 Tax=Bondarzewia mesenterica TaxID=1095465 RepID=A0A4S4M0W4_9AGAM|nr:hypothetical protein EW146_g3102 [Bondarzewia mesenterica]